MEIQILGTGSAFCLHNHQSNLIVKKNKKILLVDAGGDIRFSLKNAGYGIRDIDALYISHLHNDHIGGMEYLALYSYFDPGDSPIKLFIHQSILKELWDNALKAGLSSVQNKTLALKDYFNIFPISSELIFEWQNIKFALIPTPHIFNGKKNIFTYGLFIEDNESKKSIYLTGDTQFNPIKIQDAYNDADLIIHDCETSEFKSSVHSHYNEIKMLDSHVKNKTYLWHYQDNVIKNFDYWQKKSKKDGFQGFIKKSARFIVNKNNIKYKDD